MPEPGHRRPDGAPDGDGDGHGSGSGRGRGWALWRAALLAVMAVPAALYVAQLVLFFDYPLVDRGWTIDHLVHNAWQLVLGEPLYSDPRLGSPTAFMYAPGFTLMLFPLVAWFGPELWTARLVNLLGSALLVALVVRESARRVSDRRLAWFAAGLIFLLGITNGHHLLVAHPENWALAFTLLALVAARRAAETGRGLAPAVLASCAAVATKQTTLVYVLAAAAPLLVSQRPWRAALYLAGVAAVLGAATAWAQHATEGRFLAYMLLADQQHLVWDRPLQTLIYVGYYLGPCVLVCLVALARRDRPRPALVERLRDPFLVALLLTVPATALVMVKGGSAANNLLALTLLLVPFVAQAVDALLPALARRPALAAAAAALALGWALWRAANDVPPRWTHVSAHGQALTAARRLDEIVRAAEGPIWIPLDISLAYRNDLPVVSPAAILAEYRFDPAVLAPLRSALETGAFRTILLHDTLYSLLPESVLGPPLRAGYRPTELVVSTPSVGLYGSVIVLERKE